MTNVIPAFHLRYLIGVFVGKIISAQRYFALKNTYYKCLYTAFRFVEEESKHRYFAHKNFSYGIM